MQLSQSTATKCNLIAKGLFSILLLGTINKQTSFLKFLLSHGDTLDQPDISDSSMMMAEYFGNGGSNYDVTGKVTQDVDAVTSLSSKLAATLLSSTLYRDTYKYVAPLAAASPIFASSHPNDICGSGSKFDAFFSTGVKDRSDFGEDRIIYDTFFKEHIAHNPSFKGAYVEIGSFNGRGESTTRFFDRCLGWEGLLIDANPKMYDITNSNRPYAHRMSFAPACENSGETIKFAATKFSNSGLVGYAKAFDKHEHLHIDVPCGPLSPVLKDIFADRGKIINFFSLDVEASEELVLNTIDFEKIHIDILMVEVECEFSTEKDACSMRERIRAKMYDAGYTVYGGLVPRSDVYLHPRSPFQ